MRTKESPGDTEESTATSATNKGRERANPVTSKKPLAEGPKNNAKLVLANVEDDVPTTIDDHT